MLVVHFLTDAYQWRSHSPVYCYFVRTICQDEIAVDKSIAVLTIWEYTALYDSVVAEVFAIRTDYQCHLYSHTTEVFQVVGGILLRASGSICFGVKI